MFVVFLKFSDNKNLAGQYMDDHNSWIKSGFEAGVFLLAGSLQPSRGGAILAHNISLEDLHSRVNDDPFVTNNIVIAEINEISPAKTDDRLGFLTD